MVALSLYLPTWPTDVLRCRRRLDPRTAIVLCRPVHRVETVAAACARARRAGVTPGMTVAHARALLPASGTLIEPIDDERTTTALKKLAAWSLRFIPVVALEPSHGSEEPDGLLCDATGCERLYSGLDRLAERFLASVRGLGVAARLALAPTFGAAWALARFGPRSPVVVASGDLAAELAGLPTAALRLDPAVVESLRQVGVERVRELLRLPRGGIAARYGPETLLRIDQSLGRATETITPIRPREAIRAEIVFDGPTDRVESIRLAVREALDRVALRLGALERGCRGLELRLDRSDLPPWIFVTRTARPTRDAGHLWSLLSPRVEAAHLGFGVQGVRLTAAGVCRMRHEQGEAWGRPARASDAVTRLVDTLNARLGVGRVLRVRPVESHRPERAFRVEPVVDLEEAPEQEWTYDADRPSLLYDSPPRTEVVLLMPDGPIASIRLGGRSERVVASLGPERIEPEWWRRDDGQEDGEGGREGGKEGGKEGGRDYYKVLTEHGRVLWVYRDDRGWAVHGVWA